MSRAALATGPEPLGWIGDIDPEFLVVGHSHVGCVIESLEQGLNPDLKVAATRPPNVGLASLSEAYWKMVIESAPGRTVAIVWQGNEHNAQFLLEAQRFKVWDPHGNPTRLDELAGPWVPRTLVKDLFAAKFDGLAELVQVLQLSARVVIVGTPPPKPEPQVRAGLSREEFFSQQAAELGLQVEWDPYTVPVAPESIRVALWRILQEMADDIAVALGVEFLAAPNVAMSPEGLLLPEYCAADCTHANTLYGVRVLESLGCLGQQAEESR